MTKSFKLTLIAATLVAGTLASARAEAQKWRGAGRGQPPPQGTGRLRNAAQGMCLDVAGWAAQGDANVLLWECNDDPDHVWSFTSEGELHSMNGTCLDAAGYRGEQGANIDVFRCEALDDQRWKLVPRGRGTFELRNGKRGLCLDVNGRAGARGDKVLLWACDGAADQLWSFESYAPRPTYRRPHAVSEPPHPMEEERFRALVAAVRDASFSDSQLTVIQQAVTRNYLRVGQIKNLIDLVAFSATKLRVLELGASRDRRSRERVHRLRRVRLRRRQGPGPADPAPQRALIAELSRCLRACGAPFGMTGCPRVCPLGKLLN